MLALLVPACTSPGPEGPRSSLEEIRDTLRARARHLLAGQVDAYLGPVAAEARPVEELIALGAPTVPLATMDLVLNPPAPLASDATELRDVVVRFVFTYEGVPDDNRQHFEIEADFEKQDRGWVQTSASAAGPQPLWATGPVEVHRSAHFLTMYRPGLADVDRHVALAEEGRSRLLPRVTMVIDEVHIMTLAAGADEMRSLWSGSGSPPLAFAGSFGAHGAFPTDRIIVVDAQRVSGLGRVTSEDGREVSAREVFQHELGHLALTRYSSFSLPDWVAEGAAMYLAEEYRSEAWGDPRFLQVIGGASLGSLYRFEGLPGPLYPYANAAVLHLVETFGADRFWDFYRAFLDYGAAPAPSPDNTDRVMKRFLGIDQAELDTATREYIAARGAA